jgi:hypothetical protein
VFSGRYAIRHKKKKKELSFGHATQQSVLTASYELRLKKRLIIESIINIAQPDGSILTDEIYVCPTVKIKQALTKEPIKQRVHTISKVGPARCTNCFLFEIV